MRRFTSQRALACAMTPILFVFVLAIAGPPLARFDQPLQAATDVGCEGGGFSVVLAGGTISGTVTTTVPAVRSTFHVQGRYIEFDVVSATFEVRDYAMMGAPNPVDITGGRPHAHLRAQNA
jgi:hypothetical protein